MNDLSNLSFEVRLELFFERAVQAWLLLKDEAGLVAALAAAKTFNAVDRKIIITVLDNLAQQGEEEEADQIVLEAFRTPLLDEFHDGAAAVRLLWRMRAVSMSMGIVAS